MYTYLNKNIIQLVSSQYEDKITPITEEEDDYFKTILIKNKIITQTELNDDNYVQVKLLKLITCDNKLYINSNVKNFYPYFKFDLQDYNKISENVMFSADEINVCMMSGILPCKNSQFYYSSNIWRNNELIYIYVMDMENIDSNFLYSKDDYMNKFYNWMDGGSKSIFHKCVLPTVFNDYSAYEKNEEEYSEDY